MTEVFVIRNQLGHFWGKSKAWVSGKETRTIMRAKHEDQAINTLFELSSKDYELRGEVVPVEVSERGEPVVEVSEIPVPEELKQEVVEESVPEEDQATEETKETEAETGEQPPESDQSETNEETLH
jgi:hypothetical protein